MRPQLEKNSLCLGEGSPSFKQNKRFKPRFIAPAMFMIRSFCSCYLLPTCFYMYALSAGTANKQNNEKTNSSRSMDPPLAAWSWVKWAHVPCFWRPWQALSRHQHVFLSVRKETAAAARPLPDCSSGSAVRMFLMFGLCLVRRRVQRASRCRRRGLRASFGQA